MTLVVPGFSGACLFALASACGGLVSAATASDAKPIGIVLDPSTAVEQTRDSSAPADTAPLTAGSPIARAAENAIPTGPLTLTGGDLGCGELLMNAVNGHDGYAWQYGGVVPPEYGSFAECYSGEYEICSAVFRFGQVFDSQAGQTMDVFVWDDSAGEPGAVLCYLPDVEPGPISHHPTYSTHVFPLEGCCVSGDWWIGWWPNWPDERAGWLIANDLDGPGGCPLSKVAPGIGYPTGWQNVSVVWGPTQSMWIGAEVLGCSVPVIEASWGRIKTLY